MKIVKISMVGESMDSENEINELMDIERFKKSLKYLEIYEVV